MYGGAVYLVLMCPVWALIRPPWYRLQTAVIRQTPNCYKTASKLFAAQAASKLFAAQAASKPKKLLDGRAFYQRCPTGTFIVVAIVGRPGLSAAVLGVGRGWGVGVVCEVG